MNSRLHAQKINSCAHHTGPLRTVAVVVTHSRWSRKHKGKNYPHLFISPIFFVVPPSPSSPFSLFTPFVSILLVAVLHRSLSQSYEYKYNSPTKIIPPYLSHLCPSWSLPSEQPRPPKERIYATNAHFRCPFAD